MNFFSSKGLGDHVDLGSEYIASAVARRLLKRDVPEIGLVVKGSEIDREKVSTKPIRSKDGSKYLALRSKFFEKFQTYYDFIKGGGDKQKVVGFSRVIAGIIIMGEVDPHAGNIGIVERKSQTGSDVEFHAVKIDHGRALMPIGRFCDMMEFDKSDGELGQFTKWMSSLGYSISSIVGREFISTLEWMSEIKRDEIEKIIRKQVYDLRDVGFDLTEMFESHGGLGKADPDKVVKLLVDNVMANMDFARNMIAQLKRLNLNELKDLDIPVDELSDVQKKAMDLGEKASVSTKLFKEKSEELAKIESEAYDINKGLLKGEDKVYKELQEKWGAVKSGFVAKLFGLGGRAFEMDPKSESSMILMNEMSEVLKSNFSMRGKVEILIQSIHDKKLTKEGVENAIIEIMQESKLSPDKQMSSINKLNDALDLTNIDPKSYTKDQADKGRGR